MTWNERKDIFLLKEIAAEGVFSHKYLSRERGSAWQTVAENLNANLQDFQELTSRSVRDRFTILHKKYKAKIARESRESGGGGGDPSEAESLLDDLMSLAEETEKESNFKKRSCQQGEEKGRRITAMERMKKRSFVNDSSDNGSDHEEKIKRSRRSHGMAKGEGHR